MGELQITYTVIGEVTDDKAFSYGDAVIGLDEAEGAWTGTLEKVFATRSGAQDGPTSWFIRSEKKEDGELKEDGCFHASKVHICSHKIAQPTVFIPVFPGTNCEYDSAKAFERAGARVITKVFRNMDAADIVDSVGRV